jgi:amino acid adenylation domain-containing protein/thioester reductase-like protein
MTNDPFLSFRQLFEQQVVKDPTAVALISDEEKMTYDELNEKANQLANYLLNQGVNANSLIGIAFERSFEMIISILAIFKAGAAYVPLDPEYPTSRLQYIINETQIGYLLTQERIANSLPASDAQVILVDQCWKHIEAMSIENPISSGRPDDLAYIIFTSGTTGLPKGVMIEQAGLTNMSNEQARIFQIQPDDRIIQLSSICFDASIFEIVMALRAGAKLCLIPKQNMRVGVSLFHFLKKYQVTCVTIVPSVLNLLPVEDLPGLKTIISAGEACTRELVDRWVKGGRRFFNAYGPTETTVWATIEECHYGTGNPAIGTSIENMVAYILDEQLREVPIGSDGELYLGGIQVARGYWNNSKITEERFIPNPYGQDGASRLYKTGDFGRKLADGRIEFIGRAEHLLKINGFRVNPSEIQDAISKHPAIKQTCVTGWVDEAHGKKLVAYIVLKEKGEVTVPELKALLKEFLPSYMIPSQYMFISDVPLTENGKINWGKLPYPNAANGEMNRFEVYDSFTEELREIWLNIFQLDHVDITAHFFDDLGGDSLSAMDLLLRLEKKYSMDLPIRILFEAPTIETMAEAIYSYGNDQIAAAQDYLPAKINYDEEVQLDHEILNHLKERAQAETIFLTGSTGFLGSFLLRELLDTTESTVYCLVRANSKVEGKQRIKATFQKYQIPQYNLEKRVQIILGNLSSPFLGLTPSDFYQLSGKIDSIYHCASKVNFVYPYHRLKRPNVDGTKEIIRLASSGKEKVLHYVSTLAVYGSVGYFNHPAIPEEELEHLDSLHMGYAESKAVADKLVVTAGDHGLPVCVYRLDDVIGHNETGIWNTDDFICRYMKGCIQLGIAPELDIRINAVPVNYMTKIIVYLSRQKGSVGKAFNIFNPHNIHQQDMFDFFSDQGYHLQRVPFPEWREVLLEKVSQQKDNALYPLIPLFKERYSDDQLTVPEMYEEHRRPHFLNTNTVQGLQHSGILIPKLDGDLFQRYFHYFKEIGFLPAPVPQLNS